MHFQGTPFTYLDNFIAVSTLTLQKYIKKKGKLTMCNVTLLRLET